MLSLNVGIRFLIEFSSILMLAFLCIIHELTDVTLAKQFNIDHASNQASNFADDVAEQAASSLPHLPPSPPTTSEQSIPEHVRKNYLKFTPETLHFGHQPISMPVIETVFVQNSRPDEVAIQLISISGNTEHFHCSFFEEKLVPSGMNTSFQVVFLARQEGLVNNTLYIHSSAGSFTYRVSAFGEASPFRVRPLIGARVPLNASFASLIYMYNPFSTPLQLTEMYTSGGGLHLELPEDDENDVPSAMWKVPPYETRPVMKAHFVSRIPSNHTSYIRIRTNASEIQLMLPVEVEVSNSPGLYTTLDTLDFGVLRSRHDPPKVLPIQVINAAMKFIYVQNIVVTPLSEGLSVSNFDGPVKLSPRTSSPYHIADLVLDPRQFLCTGLCIGKVLVKSKNNQYKLAIPFVVRIIQGELHFNSSLSHFFINESSTSEQRAVTVENRFDSPMLVHEIVLPDEAKPYFKLTINEPSMPILLFPRKPFTLLNLEFTPSPLLSQFSSVFRLMTNYSYFELPLFAYSGRLNLFIPNSSDQSNLDFGLIGLNEKKSSTFVVSNHNPIAIQLLYWQCDLAGVSVEFVGTSHGNITALNQQRVSEQTKNLSRSEATLLQPNHFAVFRVHVNQLSEEGSYAGQITITTPFESRTFPLKFNVLRGSLQASKVILPRTFPGRIVSAMLQVKSNYTSEIKLKGAFVEPKDERFQIKISSNEPMMIKPGEDNHMQVLFDASAFCLQKMCYTALDIEKEVGHLWLLGSSLYSDTAYIDKELYRLLRNQWMLLTESDKSPAVNIRLKVDGFGSFITEAQAQLYWPRIANKLSIRFPSVRIGRSTTKELMVENPADRPILIQALNVVDYPNPDVLFQLMANNFFHQQWSKSDIETFEECVRNGQNISSVFSFVNSTATIATGPLNSNRINEWLGVAPNANSYTMILPPGARQRLAITFYPKDENNFTSLLVLRNNLTIIDVVMLKGEGGRGLLKIGQMLPNSAASKLMFEFSEKQLERKCRINGKSSTEKVPLNNGLIIKEKFRAINIGRMGMQIRSFMIDGMPCEGHGFHISHCEPLFLQPNQSIDIEIVYSPDFTTPMVSHELTVLVDDDTLTSGQKFKLVAAIPQKYLRPCLEMLPRPLWESFIYYLLVAMALFVLLLSIVVAISDAHRITSFSDEDQLEALLKHHEEKANKGVHGKSANPDVTKKSTENGQSITSNGKVQHQQQQQQQSTKVRNRKGNKGVAGSGPGVSSSAKSSFRPSNMIPSGNTHRLVDQSHTHSSSTTTRDDDWGNVMNAKKVLVRQDSTSSEHSQRSSDTSSTASSQNNINKSDSMNDLKVHSKKSATDSSNEPLQHTTLKMSISNDVKHKRKDQVEKKIGKKATNSKIVGKLTKFNEGKSSKLLEKAASVDAASTKSSSESLNYISKLDLDLGTGSTTKARSATLPLTSESKNAMIQSVNVSISQSDMSNPGTAGHSDFNIGRTNGYNGTIGKSQNKHTGKQSLLSKTSLENAFSDYQSVMSHSSRESNNVLLDLAKRDIWDSPITSFDSEMAMSMLVRQTEEFAAHEPEKLTSSSNGPMYSRSLLGSVARKVIAPPPGLPIPSHQRHDSGSSNNSNITRLSEEKFEIGEWSNDLIDMNSIKSRYQQEPQNKFNREMFATGDSIRDMQFENAAAKSRNFHRFGPQDLELRTKSYRSSYKSSYPVGHSLASVISSTTTTFSAAATSNNSSLASPTPSSSSTTFSPVIGRPNPPTTINSTSSSLSSTQTRLYGSTSSNGSHFADTFSLQSSLDSPFSLKSGLLADIDWPANLATNYTPPVNSASAVGSHQPTTHQDNKLNSLFTNWSASRNSQMDSFSTEVKSNSYLHPTTVDSIKKPTTSNTIFDYGSTESSVWNSPSSWTTFDKPQATKTSKGSISDTTLNTKWPSPPSSVASGGTNANTTSATGENRSWSPFDGYRLNSSPTLTLADVTTSPDSRTDNIFEPTAKSVFELFGGSSPWSPLGSSPLDGSLAGASSSIRTTAAAGTTSSDSFTERFPPNPSPTLSHHSSSSVNSSSHSSS